MGVTLTVHLLVVGLILLSAISAFAAAKRIQYERRRKREPSLSMTSAGRVFSIGCAIIASGFVLVGAWEILIHGVESQRLIGGLYALASICLILGAHQFGIWWGNRTYDGRRSTRTIR